MFACKFRELKLQQTFSEVAKKGQMLKKEMYLGHGRLKVRNSEIMDVEMTNISETNQLQLLSFGIARNSTLSELKVDL